MTCKDCIHYDICLSAFTHRGMYIGDDAEKMECFKNKADFVEVVRCKNCEHYEADIICEGVGYCNEHQKGMRENNFCSYGVRKGD